MTTSARALESTGPGVPEIACRVLRFGDGRSVEVTFFGNGFASCRLSWFDGPSGFWYSDPRGGVPETLSGPELDAAAAVGLFRTLIPALPREIRPSAGLLELPFERPTLPRVVRASLVQELARCARPVACGPSFTLYGPYGGRLSVHARYRSPGPRIWREGAFDEERERWLARWLDDVGFVGARPTIKTRWSVTWGDVVDQLWFDPFRLELSLPPSTSVSAHELVAARRILEEFRLRRLDERAAAGGAQGPDA